MNKRTLLLMMLSVYAMHAADDEAKKEQELAMQRIENPKDVYPYIQKIVAFTSTSPHFNRTELTFTLEQDTQEFTAARFGIIEYGIRNSSLYGNRILHQITMFSFIKPNHFGIGAFEIGSYYPLGRADDSCSWLDQWPDNDFLRAANLKIRLATLIEKQKLKQALLNGEAVLNLKFALKYLDPSEKIDE